MSKKLILIGGGGHCKSVIDVAESSGYSILGILDILDNVGTKVLGYPILGTDNEIEQYLDTAQFLITVGQIKSPSLRMKLHSKVVALGGKFATLVASSAYVSRYASIGEGTVILHKAVVNAGVIIGENSIINTCANVEHDVIIGDHTHVSTGVMINGGCKIGDKTFIGSQSVLTQGVIVSNDVVIGAASFINKNISESGVYVGNPMLKIR